MNTRTACAAILCCSLLILSLAGQAPQRSGALPGVPGFVREALLAGEVEASLAALDRAAAAEPALADTLAYLRAVALGDAGRRTEALAALDRFAEIAPAASPWKLKARFLRAELLRGERRFAEAQAIYEEEARRLSGPERQAELAAIYLRFAEELAAVPAGAAPNVKPDFARAAELFGRALELGAPDDVRERAAYRRAQCLEGREDWSAAASAFAAYLDWFDPTSGASGAATGRPEWIFGARLARGRAQLRAGDGPAARRAFEDLSAELRRAAKGEGALGKAVRALPPERMRALLELDGEAQYALAGTWFAGNANRLLGIAALARFVERFPDHARAPRARLELGEAQVAAGQSDAALATFDAILAAHAASGRDAVREIAARALYVKGLTLSSADRHEEAREAFARYTSEHPSGADWSEAQQRILASEYAVGVTLREREELDAARKSWTEYLARHPLDPNAARILFDVGELDAAVAAREETPEAERPARWRSAVAAWRELEAKYQSSDVEWTGRARLRIGEVLERELDDFAGAMAAYKSCETTPYAGAAAQALREMSEPSLRLSVERAALAAEPLEALLLVRNVEKVEVELWKLDLEAYFRKHLTHADVESLDLDLIGAQQKLEVAIAGYARHKPLEQRLELPVQGPGAWVIAVTAGKLRASALCLRGDLDLIVKPAPHETLVFVQDMARGAPAEGVRVLCALGERQGSAAPVVLEASTDARGCARFALEPRASAGHAAVLALRDGHAASSGVDFPVFTPAPLQPRAVLYTDRPAYRPGETVHWRAIVRGAQDERVVVQPGRTVELSFADARGRVVQRHAQALSEYGTVSGDFELPPASAIGAWSLSLALDGAVTAGASFTVAHFQLVHVALEAEFERAVYYRGEEAVARIHARYAHGGPVADAPLACVLPDGREAQTRTDAEGRARIVFGTRELEEEQLLSLRVTLSDEPLTSVARAWLSLREFSLALRTPRDTYAEGAPFSAHVTARGPDGAGLARKLRLSTLRIVERPGRPRAETATSEVEVETDGSGEAHPVLRIEKPGSYVVRISAIDRFGNPIEARTEVEIAGEGDLTTLRLYSDTDTLKAGSRASVSVGERGKGGLALATFEAGRVVDWRWIQLAPGQNPLEFDVSDELAPSFSLQVTHQRRGELRQAALEFTVERDLEVTVRSRGEVLVPGSEGAVELEVRDALGRPVAAELSLAIVDDALFDLYPAAVGGLRALAALPPRAQRPGLSTASSCEFRYEGATSEISSEVLAEAKRVVADREWAEQRAHSISELARAGPASPGAALAPSGGIDAQDEFMLGAGGGGGGFYGGRRAGGRTFGGPAGGMARKDKNAEDASLGLESPTAHWSASIVTNEAGKAVVVFPAPASSARWRVDARAAAKDPRAAEATAFFTTRAEFFVELRAPAALVEGDQPRFAARLHNTTQAALKAEVELVLRGAGVESTLPAGSVLVPPGSLELAFPASPQTLAPGTLALELEATAEIAGKPVVARARSQAVVAPWGVECAASASGELTDRELVELELPRGRKYAHLSLELCAGASLDAALIDEALGVRRPMFRAVLADMGALAADLLGSAEVLAQLARSGRDSSSEHARVRARVASLAAALIAAQEQDGGWPAPRAQPGAGDPALELDALAMLALAAARDGGVLVPPAASDAGLLALDRAQRGAQDDEHKALLQHALARWQRGDYGALNRLHRMRNELSTAALAHAALALSAIDRAVLASEIAAVIEARGVSDAAAPRLGGCFTTDKNLPWSRSRLSTAAWCTLALEGAAPRSLQLPRAVQYLVAHRPWSDPRSRGVALAALARHAGATVPANERCTVTASVDGAAPVPLDLSGGSLVLPIAETSGGKLRLELALTGRGRPHFEAVLRGFAPEPGTFAAESFSVGERRVLAPAPLWRGKPVSVGFSTVRNARERWTNQVASLARGSRTWAHVTVRRDERTGAPGDWLVLEVPLPAGTRVRADSVSGGPAPAEVFPDRLVAYLPPDVRGTLVQFELEAAYPGHYRVGAPVLRSASDPGRIAIGKPSEFDVLPLGTALPDAYRATPDELYALGMGAWEAGEKARAREWLSKLMQEFQAELADDNADSPLQRAAGALFFLALEAEDAAEVVRWFEVLREKRSELVIPFDKILAVARAYSKIDEHERALSILRATVEETFGVDLKIPGALEEQGDASEALRLLARLWNEYPDAPPVLEAWLALSDKLLTRAPKAGEDKSLLRDGRTRAALHAEGTRILQTFLCLYPRDPQAGEAALALISAHLGLEDYATASTLAAGFAARFRSPEFADAFLYSRAVAEWYLGHDEEALRVCERVATAVYKDAHGIERPSKNRELAQYILAQIHHARRDVEHAAEYYAKVEQSFADARDSLAELRARRLALDEVARARPGETAQLVLRSKNVAEVELSVYPVDLMTLYLREADLSKVAEVDLSGIAPELTRTARLSGNALREAEQKLELQLAKPGAYLVIARGGELFASGLVLVTDLELDVTEDVERGGVRVQVVDGRDGKYVRGVDVRVVGSADRRIQRSLSDLRGMAAVDSVQGLATVIARAGEDRYAFWRGTRPLGAQDESKRPKPSQAPEQQLSQQDYLSNVLQLNEQSQGQRAGRLVEEIGKRRPGVQINQVK